MGPLGIQELLLILCVIVALLGFVFWVWMLIDCATKESDEGNTKIVWVIIIVFSNIVGAVIYWIVRRPQRQIELHR
jgi:phospholipase D-like protein